MSKFRVALSGHFRDHNGTPALPDFDLRPLEADSDIEYFFIDGDADDDSDEDAAGGGPFAAARPPDLRHWPIGALLLGLLGLRGDLRGREGGAALTNLTPRLRASARC